LHIIEKWTYLPLGPLSEWTGFEPFVIQPAYVEQNAREIAWAILGFTDGDARTLLHTTLNRIQPDTYNWTPGASGPDIQFDAVDGLQEAILRRIMVVDELPSSWEFEAAIRPECRTCVQRAFCTLAELDPEIHRAVTMVLAAILFGRLEHFGGGSNSSAIGCLWLNPKPTWTDIDWLENIFHEYVHQCLFIDDMRHGLFEVDGQILAEDKALVVSALLEIPRPYDRAFHSCFVSFALMQLALLIRMPERVVPHVQPLRVTLNRLREKSHYLTPHGSYVLEALDDAFAAFQSANANRSRVC
jgi:hypothetical protein